LSTYEDEDERRESSVTTCSLSLVRTGMMMMLIMMIDGFDVL
jgi:hypothetical protein